MPTTFQLAVKLANELATTELWPKRGDPRKAARKPVPLKEYPEPVTAEDLKRQQVREAMRRFRARKKK